MDGQSNIVIKPALLELFEQAWAQTRVILFSAPFGAGKTAAAQALLARRKTAVYSAVQLEDLDIPPACEAVMVEELQMLNNPDGQKALCARIRENSDKHFLLLSRGGIPGWLMPFQFAGMLSVIDSQALFLDRESIRRVLEGGGAAVSEAELSAITRETKGYPVAVACLCRHLRDSGSYDAAVADATRRELFHFMEEAVFRRFAMPLRQLLLHLAPFDGFDPELARMVSGDSHVSELLSVLLHDTSMLEFEGVEQYRFRPIFREFLLWEMNHLYTQEEQRTVYARAGLYYELRDDYGRAMDCYIRCGDHQKVSELLVKNAEMHVGAGHYYEMEPYYEALEEKDVLRSVPLMCGMSMLSSLNMDYEASERWYAALQSYAAGLQKSDAEYKEAHSRLAYLDIALPHRGSKGLAELFSSVFRVMTNREIVLPAVSVTSTLPSLMKGGKDFCDWSKRDELLYATLRKPVESVLGRDGVGLGDCALCESQFEKGENVTERLLTLVARMSEIRKNGTPDMEFAVMGLLIRLQVSQGRADAALTTLEDLRAGFAETGGSRFLPNMDAMRVRIWLRLGMLDEVERWYQGEAPGIAPKLRTMWRYRYHTRALVEISKGDYDSALLVLTLLLPYCRQCGRTMDALHFRLLTALCHYRQSQETWREEICAVLDTAQEYRFIQPVAQYGGAVLPLLTGCGWKGEKVYFKRLVEETRTQAVNYPDFLRPMAQIAAPLSPAERQVLKLICFNRSNQEIADTLGIKLATVKTHINHILQKLGVRRRSEAKEAAETLHLL